jgi:serine/threonine-protein kinase
MEPVILNDRYQLLEQIGSGGMAVVYRGMDTLLQRQVAVKILRDRFSGDPSFLARFRREAQSAANLDHPNIVTVYDVGQDGERHYMVMEYVAGQDLKTLIRQKGHLAVDEAVDIAVQICEGVGHAHQAGLVHCDIKPHNVLLTEDGRAKVVDFGIARALSESGLTESETVWGSPLYFSPEQASGDPPSPASDVYSIGVIMYEMLTGAPPFQAENATALAMLHLQEEPAPLAARNPQVPSQLEEIVHTVLSKEPSARYRTAAQLARVLEEYHRLGEQATSWQPATPRGGSEVPFQGEEEPESEMLTVSDGGSDEMVWVLSVVAFIAVVGLIPLWWLVYQSYAALPSPVTRTPTPLVTRTPEPVVVSVPALVDESVEDARRMVEREGLVFEVEEERDETQAQPNVVLEQEPAPGEAVTTGTTVRVVVSAPGRELTMPDVVGYPLSIVKDGLESDGLEVAVEDVWHTEQEGQVVSQTPEPESTVRVGETVTLTVSAGADAPIPLQVNLADLIILEEAELRRKVFKPGDLVVLTLRWRAQRTIDKHYVVFVHLIDPDVPSAESLVAQEDTEPRPSTNEWMPGVEVVDPHRLTIPSGVSPGEYQLRVGMYERSGERLSVIDAGQTTAEADSILVMEIEVQP